MSRSCLLLVFVFVFLPLSALFFSCGGTPLNHDCPVDTAIDETMVMQYQYGSSGYSCAECDVLNQLTMNLMIDNTGRYQAARHVVCTDQMDAEVVLEDHFTDTGTANASFSEWLDRLREEGFPAVPCQIPDCLWADDAPVEAHRAFLKPPGSGDSYYATVFRCGGYSNFCQHNECGSYDELFSFTFSFVKWAMSEKGHEQKICPHY